jgi:hypothetical protein
MRGVDALAETNAGDWNVCADGALVAESLAAVAAHAQAAADSSGLALQRAFSGRQPTGTESAAIYRFLATMTASSGDAPGIDPFSDAEVGANRVAAADFLAWFRNEPGVTGERPFGRPTRGSPFRLTLAVVASAVAVGVIAVFAVSIVLRRARRFGP